MAIINSYPTVTPQDGDLVVITDVSTTPNSTKTATVGSIAKQVTLGYSSYVATFTQAGGAAPVDTVLKNDTGLTFTWARSAAGIFTLSPSSNFDVSKTWIQVTGGEETTPTLVLLKSVTSTTANIVNINLASVGNRVDGIATASIEVRIYS